MNRRIIWAAFGVLLVLAVVIFTIKPTETSSVLVDQAKPLIKIGIPLPLSSNYAATGESLRAAANMALDEMKRKPLKFDYQLIFEDNQMDNAKANLLAQKLINMDKVDAITSLYSPSGKMTSPLAQQNKVIHIGMMATDPVIAKGEYNFTFVIPDELMAKSYLEYARKKGIKKIGYYYTQFPGIINIESKIRELAPAFGIEIKFAVATQNTMHDFRTELTKNNSKEVDSIGIFMNEPSAMILVRQLRELGVTIPLSSFYTIAITERDKLDVFEGMWGSDGSFGNEDFDSRLAEYTKDGQYMGTAYIYEAVKLLVNSYEETASETGKKPLNSDVVKTISNKKNISTVFGDVLVDDRGVMATKPSIRQVINGKAEIVE